MRWRLVCLLALLLASAGRLIAGNVPSSKAIPPKSWSVRWQPTRLVNGTPVIFSVTPPARLASLSGTWLSHEIFFSSDAAASKAWYGIAGVSLETPPGSYALTLKGTTAQGKELVFQRTVSVKAAKYPSVHVSVAKKFTEPSPEQLKQISEDKAVKEELFSRVTQEREWSGDFRAPVEARISDIFGTRRVFNGKVQSMHQGLDYAVPAGTPVAALNRGTVLLARPLYFEGNCVVLDHGQGLLTLYLHMSEIKVKEGEQVERGQQLGLSGGTGRATGPHLHVAVRWQSVYLDPATLLRLKLP
ncbi:MAG: M23 family metallopeptidase [Acidobacteriia bacterium]|nr:M23 family metallopeptidase [Terriglobia bacterium]